MGMEQATRRWRRTSTYGGSLTENIVQAIARDCFCDAMLRMEEGYGVRILMHIHDEVVAEAPATARPRRCGTCTTSWPRRPRGPRACRSRVTAIFRSFIKKTDILWDNVGDTQTRSWR